MTGNVVMEHSIFQIDKRKRVHFNSFMTKVHAKIHEVKQQEAYESDFSSRKLKPFDPTKPVADDIANNTWLICFDEFQVGCFAYPEMCLY